MSINIPPHLVDADLDDCTDTQEPLADLLRKVEPENRVGVLLTGAPGIGKSWLAAATLNRWVGTGVSRHFVRWSDYLADVRSMFAIENRARSGISDEADAERLYSLTRWYDAVARHVQVVVIDDVGRENVTPWVITEFDRVVRTRYNHGLPTIVTTNLPMADLAMYGEATLSFIEEAFVIARLKIETSRQPDLRRSVGRAVL